MPYRKEEFINGHVYHLILRAIDDNLIFKDTNDYYRGIFSIYEFNNLNPVTIREKRKARIAFKRLLKLSTLESSDSRCLSVDRHRESDALEFVDERDKMVEVFAFCFMPNHIHLLVRQIKDGGISKFMQKNGIGLAKYFNTKYKRKGHVFQDTFRAVHIKNDNHFMVVVPYIFTNPVALIEPGWKENGIRNHLTEEVIKFIEEYKWSSYQDCIGLKNFKYVTQRDFLMEIMGGKQGCKDSVDNWIKHKKDVGQFNDLFLE
jgi:putative transposase